MIKCDVFPVYGAYMFNNQNFSKKITQLVFLMFLKSEKHFKSQACICLNAMEEVKYRRIEIFDQLSKFLLTSMGNSRVVKTKTQMFLCTFLRRFLFISTEMALDQCLAHYLRIFSCFLFNQAG